MSLPRGTRLGSYEVLDALGAGGMGEVYRARDTRLNRDVALKILPDVFAADPERLGRFQREARTLAGLNHPHIAHIHGFEEADGVTAIVMELVEGEDLAARLARGAIPLDEALPIARQIADALEEAHAHGIIHRDLKPANIKVRDDGTVKLLDFGLAKAFDPADTSSAAVANSPTLTAQATAMGVLLGTAAYMAPEQAKGKPVDKRADIWAFGVTLYEMLTGRRAFDGHDVTDVLAAVIKDTPSLDALPAATPPSIRRLLRRCLEKDRRERLGDMSGVRLEIRDALAGEATSGGATPPVTPRVGQRLAWAAAFLTLAVLSGLLAASYVRRPVERPEVRVEISTRSIPGASFALSPDGRRLVFGAADDGARRLWLQAFDTATVQPLPGTEGGTNPFWSPDSRSVAFFAGGKLMRLDIGSGSARPLANVISSRGGSWSKNDVILFVPTALDPVWQVPASGGQAVPVTKLDLPRQTAHMFPHFLPDGQRFLLHVRGVPNEQGIYLGSLGSQTTTRLTAADGAGAYLPPGWLLFVRNGMLLAQGFDASVGALRGEPLTVAERVGFSVNPRVGTFSTSATGAVVYGPSVERSETRLMWFDKAGKPLGTLGPSNVGTPALSPDGRRVAVSRSVSGNNPDIYILSGVRMTRLTFDEGTDASPIWSPDGTWIAFRSNRKGPFNLYKKRSDGTGGDGLLLDSPLHMVPQDWAQGRLLFTKDNDPKTVYDLWSMPIENDVAGTPTVFLNESHEERAAQFSPDGRWLAYTSNESGQHEVYVRPFPGPGPKSLISTAGGITPRWRQDSKELYYIAPDAALMAAPLGVKEGVLEAGVPVPLFPTRIVGGGRPYPISYHYDVAADGRFLINVETAEAVTSPLTLLLNWKPRP
jgi:eukaryotic-like serine/threonine-protein kinase